MLPAISVNHVIDGAHRYAQFARQSCRRSANPWRRSNLSDLAFCENGLPCRGTSHPRSMQIHIEVVFKRGCPTEVRKSRIGAIAVDMRNLVARRRGLAQERNSHNPVDRDFSDFPINWKSHLWVAGPSVVNPGQNEALPPTSTTGNSLNLTVFRDRVLWGKRDCLPVCHSTSYGNYAEKVKQLGLVE